MSIIIIYGNTPPIGLINHYTYRNWTLFDRARKKSKQNLTSLIGLGLETALGSFP